MQEARLLAVQWSHYVLQIRQLHAAGRAPLQRSHSPWRKTTYVPPSPAMVCRLRCVAVVLDVSC